ncbi:MAG: hypothetical protein V4734_05440 [Terriglobus sp.]
MNEANEQQDKLTEALLQALDTAPEVSVPSDFTARMMVRIPQQEAPRRRFADAAIKAPSYGRKAIFGALVVLVVLMFAFTPVARTSYNSWTTIEFVLLTQFSIFVLWLSFGKRYSQ